MQKKVSYAPISWTVRSPCGVRSSAASLQTAGSTARLDGELSYAGGGVHATSVTWPEEETKAQVHMLTRLRMFDELMQASSFAVPAADLGVAIRLRMHCNAHEWREAVRLEMQKTAPGERGSVGCSHHAVHAHLVPCVVLLLWLSLLTNT